MDHMQQYAMRRKKCSEILAQKYGPHSAILVCAGFEDERIRFRQDSSFYYLTGLNEPGIACVITGDGKSVLFVPHYEIDRSVWVDSVCPLISENAQLLCFDAIESMGQPCVGYQITPCMPEHVYTNLLSYVKTYADANTLCISHNKQESFLQSMMYSNLCSFFDSKFKPLHDVSSIIADMRRIKDTYEIDELKKAIAITTKAQNAAAHIIKSGVNEAVVRAALESVMTQHHSQPSFPSIVASGKNATILHYTACNKNIGATDMVVVDIGAESGNYAADITRTYPASGRFSARQRELYQLVLDAQTHVARNAKPGYWLKNKDNPEKSLHHIAVNFFASHGYDQFFPHGIGHYLGLDVHDVGSYATPLKAGDVITIEPGLYIRQESIGIRIEDNYLITENGVECLSAEIPKQINDIEQLFSNH